MRQCAHDQLLDLRIGRSLRRHGCESTEPPQSFLVAKDNTLLPGEQERAVLWVHDLAGAAAIATYTADF